MKKTLLSLAILALLGTSLNGAEKTASTYQDNFYRAVNQEWIDAHPVPDDKSMVSNFSAIDDTINVQLLGYYKRLGEQKTLTPNERHLWNIYQSYVDIETRNAKGVSALGSELARIDALKDKKALARLIADLSVEDYKEHTSLLYEFSAEVIKAYNDGDTHPYGEYRVNGTLRNMDAFYKAFDVKKGDKMYLPPEKRVQIWPK